MAVEDQLSPEQEKFIDKLHLFKIKGRDKRDRMILRIIGKKFPAKSLNLDVLKMYLRKKVFPKLEEKPFAVVYIHTDVHKSENFPGISGLRSVYDAIPANIKQNLEAVYFVHPDLQSRLFLATFGRFIFSGGLYAKVKYMSRLDYLWVEVRRKEVDIPEFVYDHDEELDYRPMILDYGLESDHPRRAYCGTSVDSPVGMYSMRCIS